MKTPASIEDLSNSQRCMGRKDSSLSKKNQVIMNKQSIYSGSTNVNIVNSPSKSKISTKISQSILENEIDLLKKVWLEEDYSQDIDVSEPIKNLFVKVNVILGKIPGVFETDQLKSINLQVTEKTKISELIKMSIDIFNETFEKENLQVRLITNYSAFSVKPSKKNGKADKDLPNIDNSVYVSECYVKQYTLVARQGRNTLNTAANPIPAGIVILKPKNETCCRGCMIF